MPLCRANSSAKGEGETSPRSTSRPSALETAFCVTTAMSPARRGVPWVRHAPATSSPSRAPGPISGRPVTPMISIRGTAMLRM